MVSDKDWDFKQMIESWLLFSLLHFLSKEMAPLLISHRPVLFLIDISRLNAEILAEFKELGL
jgi:hypothetical protein